MKKVRAIIILSKTMLVNRLKFSKFLNLIAFNTSSITKKKKVVSPSVTFVSDGQTDLAQICGYLCSYLWKFIWLNSSKVEMYQHINISQGHVIGHHLIILRFYCLRCLYQCDHYSTFWIFVKNEDICLGPFGLLQQNTPDSITCK